MSTQLFLHNAASDIGGSTSPVYLSATATRASSGVVNSNTNTAMAGNNIVITQVTGGTAIVFFSEPLSAPVTISGSITVNLWGQESNVFANAGAGIQIDRCNGSGAVLSNIVPASAVTTTAYTTSYAARNAAFTPTSTSMLAGDRIKITVLVDNAGGVMTAGYTVQNTYDAASSGVSGDSYVTLTENVSFTTRLVVRPVTTGRPVPIGRAAVI